MNAELDPQPSPLLDELVQYHIILHALCLAHESDAARRRKSPKCRDNDPTAQRDYSAILNTLPRSLFPEASHAVIRYLPHVELDFASQYGDLWLLDTLWKLSRLPATRHPIKLQYSTMPNSPSSTIRNTVPGPIAAGSLGLIHVLDWWASHDQHLPLHQSMDFALVAACKAEHLHVLDWWAAYAKRKQLLDSFSQVAQEAVDVASSIGSVPVLQWWQDFMCNDGGAFGCSAATLIGAITRGDDLGRQVVHWWINESARPIPHTAKKYALVAASLQPASQMHTESTTLFGYLRSTWPTAIDSTLIPYLCLSSTTCDSDSDRFALLRQLCIKHASLVTRNIVRQCFQYASLAGNTRLLDWLYSQFGLDWSSPQGSVQVFLTHASDPTLIPASRIPNEWVRCRLAELPGRRMYYGETRATIADLASALGHTCVLQWWLDHSSVAGRHFEYTDAAINQASAAGHLDALKWWADQHHCTGLSLKYAVAAMDEASRNGHFHVLTWWRNDSQLVNKVTNWAVQLPQSNPLHQSVRAYWHGLGMFKYHAMDDESDSDDFFDLFDLFD